MIKSVLLTFTLAILISSCGDGPQVKINTDTGKTERLVRKYFDHFNKHEWTELAAMYTDSADFKDPSLGTEKVKQTKKQIEDKYKALEEIFPDINDEIVNIYPSENNKIIVEFISTATLPDKTKFKLPICTIFSFEGDLIKEDFTYYDNSEE